ncbi:MAG: hypothetical protein K0Q81_1102 [Paenibacillus sp.]|nr:hypothetical protein [Paenibacillus sp.]
MVGVLYSRTRSLFCTQTEEGCANFFHKFNINILRICDNQIQGVAAIAALVAISINKISQGHGDFILQTMV